MYIILFMSLKSLVLTFFISALIHSLLLSGKFDFSTINKVGEKKTLKVQNIRLLGDKDSKKKNLLAIKTKPKKSPSLKELSFKEPITNRYSKKVLKKTQKRYKSVSLKEALKKSSSKIANANFKLANDLNIKFELPNGVKEDELNPRELVFYSFQKRTIEAYINSYIKEFNKLSRLQKKRAALSIKKPETLAGRLTYDKEGNIVSIKTLSWSESRDIQEFFLKVLRNLNTLPNPPKEMIENDKFAINFILDLK